MFAKKKTSDVPLGEAPFSNSVLVFRGFPSDDGSNDRLITKRSISEKD